MGGGFLRKKAITVALTCTTLLTLRLVSQIVHAEEVENSYDLDNVVVTASRVIEDAFSVKANVSVITREMLETNHYNNLTDALRDVPGVTIQNYGNGGGNYSSNRLYINGSQEVVILIDGMRVNTNGSTSSRFDASSLVNMAIIERVEVLKGSASTLYGSDAAGGVINIITKKIKTGDSKTTLSVTGGSASTEKYSLLNIGSENGLFWMLGAQKDISGDYKDGRGNNIPNHVNADTLDFKIGKNFDKDTSLTMTYQSYKSDYMRPTNGGLHTVDTSLGKKDNERFSLEYDNKISKKASNKITAYQNKNDLNDVYNDPLNNWLMDLKTIGFSDQLTYKTRKHEIISGFDFYQDQIENYSSTSYGYVSKWKDKHITDRAVYLEDAWALNTEWSLNTGIRVDNHSIYGQHNTPSITVGYQPSSKVNYYVGYKEFFVSPNQFQLYSSYGNMNLKPETGNTVEAGVNYKFDNMADANFHVYERNGHDMIGYNSATRKYYNVADEKAHGWDLQLNKRFNDNFSMNVAYTYTYIDPANASENANRNGYIPRGAWNIGTKYEKDRFDMQLNGRAVVNRDGRKGQNVASDLSTFWVWDTVFNYKIQKDTKAFIRVNNIFDKFYTDQCYDMDPDGSWYSAPGRTVVVGMQYSF